MLGFGAALIIVPTLVVLYGPVEAALVMSLIEVPAVAYLLPTTIRHADWRGITPLALASLLTIPLGAWLLAVVDADVTRRAIGALVVVMGLTLASGWRYRGRIDRVLEVVVGLASGVVSGLANIGGPIVVLFLFATRAGALGVRATIMAYFSFSTLYRIAVYLALAMYALPSLRLAAILAGPYLLGIWLGTRWFRKVSDVLFRRLAIALVVVTGSVALLG